MNDNNHHSIQDSLVKDSLQANDKLNMIQQSLTADTTINRQFTGIADLPESVPQGQLTRPATATPNDALFPINRQRNQLAVLINQPSTIRIPKPPMAMKKLILATKPSKKLKNNKK
ncbi:MAG: hypothetical protein U1E92_01775 [Moraxella osloensis]